MNRLKVVCYIIAASQIALGGLYLFWPTGFIAWQGLSPIGEDIRYPLSMLAARFFVYGLGMIAIARQPIKYRIWLDGMVGIQFIDMLSGAYYVLIESVAFADASVPMVNATLFIALMIWVRPSQTENQLIAG